jgi:DNA-binding MarR family transcriptional regulator
MGATLEQDEIERLVGGAPRLAYEDIVGHPRLPEARKLYLDRFLALYEGDPFLVRLLLESGRFLVYMVAIVLEAAQDPARRETWLTVDRFKRGMALFGLASDRHIDGLISRLCAVGYMERRPAEQDRRVRILTPTEKLRAHDREWLAAHFAPLSILYPSHDYGPVMRHDRQFHDLFRRTSLPFLPLGAKMFLSVPEMLLFLSHAGGYPVIAALLQAAMAQPDNPNVGVPYGDIGERFGVSRTHVRNLLAAAEQAGLVKLHARGGRRVEILPRLWSSHDRGIAGGMYLHDMVFLATERAARRMERAAE